VSTKSDTIFSNELEVNNINPPAYNLNCYPELNEAVFALEGINFYSRNDQLKNDYFEKTINIEYYEKIQTRPVPRISHQVYVTSHNNFKEVSNFLIKKIAANINGLLELDENWRFFFWVNNPLSIPQSIRELKNVEIHLITELYRVALYEDINNFIQLATVSSCTEASNLIRYSVLQIYGGIYYDLDYQFYNFTKLLQIANSFNFFAGKEFNKDFSQIGNAFIAAVADHPIINQAVEWVARNLNEIDNLPLYLKYPCTLFSLRMFRDGPSLLSLAVYKKANAVGYTDFIDITSRSFFNIEHAHATTEGSMCSKPHQYSQLVTVINGIEIETVGSDMLCGGWTPKHYFDPIFYQGNIGAYLYLACQNGNSEYVDRYLEYGVDVNDVHKETKVTPLYIAVQNGHIEIAKKLISNGASIWFKTKNGASIQKVAYLSKNDNIITFIQDQHQEILDNTPYRCFQGGKDVFIQENINYRQENKKLLDSYQEKYSNINLYKQLNKNHINKITHQIYISFDLVEMPKPLAEKTKTSLKHLNNQSWNHYIWTNNKTIIPSELASLKGVLLRDISELSDNNYFYIAEHIINYSKKDSSFLTQALDVLKLIILQKEGGIYRNLKYEISNPQELEKLLDGFNFIAEKEKDSEISYIGNSFIASSKNHSIINTALKDYIQRNFVENRQLLPLYLQYPCNKDAITIFQTGAAVITLAYFESENQDGNLDIVMPANAFYKIEFPNDYDNNVYLGDVI
jgi:mannosyltransferase OCH1-like enzyme